MKTNIKTKTGNTKPPGTRFKRTRILQIGYKYFSRAGYRHVAFPEIRLCGKWLEDQGFCIGNSVSITIDGNLIIIEN